MKTLPELKTGRPRESRLSLGSLGGNGDSRHGSPALGDPVLGEDAIGAPAFGGQGFAEVLSMVGTPRFYRATGGWLARLIDSTQFIVVRYPPFGRPEMIVDDVLPKKVLELYLAGAFLFDPLQRYWRDRQTACCAVVNDLADNRSIRRNYLEAIFRRAFIRDELALLVPAPAPIGVAFCLERTDRPYTDRDRDRAEALLPTVQHLVRLHVDLCVLRGGNAALPSIFGECAVPLAILDRGGRLILHNAGWRSEFTNALADRPALMLTANQSACRLASGWELHSRALGEDFAFAPGGRLVTARSAAHTENEPDFDQAFDRFAQRHSLTHRERDVVRLALQGSPTSHIAGQLHLSAGSVRNHRSHVYAKLDITTERELFRMFLSELLTRPS